MSEEIFGRIWHPGRLEDAVLDTLKTWLPTYLNEVCEQETERLGLDTPKTLGLPQSWAVVSDYDRFPEESLPAIIVAAPGLDGDPDREGDGTVHTTWRFEVSVTLTAPDGRTTRRNAQLYLAAIIACLLQRRSLGEDMTSIDLVDADYVDVPNEKRRTQIAAAAAFTAQIDGMVTDLAGPGTPEPPDPMPETWPTVTETTIETETE
jgi:hypothetical protein